MTPFRLLRVIPGIAPRMGGTAAHVTGSSAALVRRGHTVSIFTTDMGRAPSSLRISRIGVADLDAQLASVDVRLFRATWPQRLVYSRSLGRALMQEASQYDVIQIHNLWLYPQFMAARAAKLHNVPYVVSIHGAFDAWVRSRGSKRKAATMALWQRRMLEAASILHVTSEQECEAIADIAPHVPRMVAPPGLDLAAFKVLPTGAAFRSRHFGASQDPLVLFTGRLARKKGLDLLVKAFPSVVDAVPEARLAIVGPDDEGIRESLRHAVREAGIATSVVFIDGLYGFDLLDALAAGDAWVLPSRAENFGIAVVEACAAGLPVVSTTEVDVAIPMAAAEAGLLAALTPASIADALIRLLMDQELRDRLAENARSFAGNYEWDGVVDAHVAMYKAAIEQAGTHCSPSA